MCSEKQQNNTLLSYHYRRRLCRLTVMGGVRAVRPNHTNPLSGLPLVIHAIEDILYITQFPFFYDFLIHTQFAIATKMSPESAI